ncbi:Transcription factor tau subunit sfc3 [Grifola frondosa]|uniref:Transcription factor tau subunit sfc3 n=1 Tax=Grifola frondosa TaxID=5627 RepID=A0A1C7MU28_GRIFR|nr:Transcription factor tau subunit sfc3 [Grifola frondosa]
MDAEDGHERVSPGAEQATPRKRGRPPKKRASQLSTSAIILGSTAVQGEERPSALQLSAQENIDEDRRPVSPAVGADVSMQGPEDVPPLTGAESISQSNPSERPELPASASAGTAAESLLRRSSRKKVLRHRGDSLSPPRRTRSSRTITVPTVPSQLDEPSASNLELPPPVTQNVSSGEPEPSASNGNMQVAQTGEHVTAQNQLPENDYIPRDSNRPCYVHFWCWTEHVGFAKRAKSSGPSTELTRYRSKANISQSRREKEVLRVITEAGGIMNTTAKEFYEAHAAVVEAITKAGETASTRPGTRIDKRTLEATLADLESRQKIKLLSTFITSLTGGSRHARIAYLVDTSLDDLNTFLANLSRNFQYFLPSVVKTLDEPIAYGGANQAQLPAPPSSAITLDRDKDKDRAAVSELLRSSDTVIRESLLTEKNTVAQLYGFIIGKAARARALHTTTMQLFEDGRISPRIVSSQHRIIQLSYYYHEIPISTYCSLVSCTTQMDELGRLLASADGRQTPVQDIPADIYEVLQPLRSKPRARLFTIIELLLALNLVVPLQPSNSANPAFRCPAIGSHPTAFDVAPTDVWTSFTAPEYWRFNEIAPIRLWALQQDSPPLWKSVSLSSAAQRAAFWEELEKVSVDSDYAKQIICPDVEMESSERVVAAAKCLRRQSSWKTSYCLSWYQMEFLRQYVDTSTGNTPLQDEDGGDARLDHLCWVSSAPRDVLTHYFQKAHKRHVRSVQKLTQKTKRAAVKAEVQEERDTKALLARRAAESKRQREEIWDDMVARVHSEPLRGSAAVRVQRLRSKFLQGSGKDHQLWETRIVDAIREAELAAKQILTTAIEDLIAQQGPPLPPKQRTHKSKKAAGSVKDEAAVQRRHRFQWNRDYDELVRDASIVIKARCRGTVRLDWGALEQVFPAVPRNSVRQRFAHLRELTGADAYLKRLEEKWHDLWLEHRGTDILPDDDPASATNFDIVAHIKFLRKHIDKNALRVGFLELSNTKSKAILPTSVDQIDQVWDMVENSMIAPAWDFMWSVVSEEGREKQFAQHSFIAELNEMPAVGAYASESIYIGDSALKMTLGTPHENYDPDSASQLLKSVGERAVQTATKTLLARGAVSKTVRDPQKSKPGRTFKISDSNLNAIGGSLSRDLYQDACAFEEVLGQEEDAERWREWPLLASDGDTALLIELVSENRVNFGIDTSNPRAARPKIDWNSKKTDDDDIETTIQVRFLDVASGTRQPSVADFSVEPPVGILDLQAPASGFEHGKAGDGGSACCRRDSAGLTDCVACLEEVVPVLLLELPTEEADVVQQTLVLLRDAASDGLTKAQLLAHLHPLPEALIFSAIGRMVDAPIPLAHWTGYTSIVLVSAAHIRPWTVMVSEPEGAKNMIFPRRWLDITGRKMGDVWDAALRAVIGVILLRPGVSQSEIRWRLRSVYDRQEVNDLLQYLHAEGFIKTRVDVGARLDTVPPDDREEKVIFWFLGDIKHWYQV